MRNSLLFAIIFTTTFAFAQTGNTLGDAISLDGTLSNLNVLGLGTTTDSGLEPSCASTGDVFYKHIPSAGDNKITISMVSGSLSIGATVHYQIIKAINGDINDLEFFACASYGVTILGGDFEEVIDNISDTDVYYIRIYQMSGLGASLSALLGGTTVTMLSVFDESLSSSSATLNKIKFVTKNNSIQILNNNLEQFSYQIFSIDGKQQASVTSSSGLNNIDISTLNKGLYILNLKGLGKSLVYKFVKI